MSFKEKRLEDSSLTKVKAATFETHWILVVGYCRQEAEEYIIKDIIAIIVQCDPQLQDTTTYVELQTFFSWRIWNSGMKLRIIESIDQYINEVEKYILLHSHTKI